MSTGQLATELAGRPSGCDAGTPTTCSGCTATQPRSPWPGTALSAPVPNMLIQAAMTAVVVRWPSRGAARASAAGEPSWSPGTWASGWCDSACAHQAGDALESPLLVAAIGLPWPAMRLAGEASAPTRAGCSL